VGGRREHVGGVECVESIQARLMNVWGSRSRLGCGGGTVGVLGEVLRGPKRARVRGVSCLCRSHKHEAMWYMWWSISRHFDSYFALDFVVFLEIKRRRQPSRRGLLVVIFRYVCSWGFFFVFVCWVCCISFLLASRAGGVFYFFQRSVSVVCGARGFSGFWFIWCLLIIRNDGLVSFLCHWCVSIFFFCFLFNI